MIRVNGEAVMAFNANNGIFCSAEQALTHIENVADGYAQSEKMPFAKAMEDTRSEILSSEDNLMKTYLLN